ncbi:hypothetical protein TNCV_4664421 [Trichonephila clavipes]|nr:hypothetical protein TNCV_4664421 [Trichonephila clavipes]
MEFSTSQEWCSIPKIRIRGWKDIQVAISTSSISYPRGTQRVAWQPNRRSFRRHENFCTEFESDSAGVK